MKIKNAVLLLLATVLIAACVAGPQLILVAGTLGGAGFEDGSGSRARFNGPSLTAVASNGDVLVLDSNNNAVRRINSQGGVSTFASWGLGRSDFGMVEEGAGNLYVTDTLYNNIRKITPDGTVSTFAGSSSISGESVDGSLENARFNAPAGLAIGPDGELYVADQGSGNIRKITADNQVVTLKNAADEAVSVNGVTYLAVDAAGTIYAVGALPCIYKISPAGEVSILAGTEGEAGNVDGTGDAARFEYMRGIAVDMTGNVYVPDSNNSTIRKVTATGVVTTLAGTAGQKGDEDGSGIAARFFHPIGLSVAGNGTIYVADMDSNTVRKITATGNVTTLAGLSNKQHAAADGSAGQGWLRYPVGIVRSSIGGFFVLDRDNFAIREIKPSGALSTVAGKIGLPGSDDGAVADATFNYGSDIALDQDGNIFVSDTMSHVIRKISTAGVVSTFAGTMQDNPGFQDGTGNAARFFSPTGLVFDATGNLWVADSANHAVRKITPTGEVTTLAGGNGDGNQDGPGNLATFGRPQALAISSAGILFVADSDQHTIRKILPDGTVATIAGQAGVTGSRDGKGAGALFSSPQGIAVDATGNLFVADSGNNAIRKITPAGKVTTVVGDPARHLLAPGALRLAGLGSPRRVILLPQGQLAITTQNAVVITQGARF